MELCQILRGGHIGSEYLYDPEGKITITVNVFIKYFDEIEENCEHGSF